ncbi:MAG: hypothetical protein WC789_06710 [Lentisphaeria bacterium]|jgi:hypothetical protein
MKKSDLRIGTKSLCRLGGAALFAGALLGSLAGRAAEEAAALLPNGGFEQSANQSAPDGWGKLPAGATWEQEDGNHFLRLKTPEAGKTVMLYRAVQLPADAKELELSYRVRYADVKPGKEAWFDGRIMMNFKDAPGKDGKMIKPSPKAPSFRGSSAGWVERKQQIAIPDGAKVLELMPSLFQAAGGTLDFDDFKLVPVAAPAP